MIKGELESAVSTCDEAIKYGQRAAYNNRGVLRALQGDFEAADKDFAIATRQSGNHHGASNTLIPRRVAKENAARADEQFAARKKRGDTTVATGDE